MFDYPPPPSIDVPPIGSNYYKLTYDPEYEEHRKRALNRPRLENKKYRNIHTKNLVPLPIVIDCDLFENEIFLYDNDFEQFGNTHTELQRYSIGLTDLDIPIDSTPSPVNWPMDTWIVQHPDQSLLDTDFKNANNIMRSLKSLDPMKIFYNHLARCCILKWNTGAHFKPHIDVKLPAPNLRIWGTNDPENNHFCFWDGSKYVAEKNVEKGRLYLADTSKYHHAYSTDDYVYTFFFALQISSYNILKEMLC